MSSSNSLIVILVARATKLYQCANSPQHQATNRSAKSSGPQAARSQEARRRTGGGGAAEPRRRGGRLASAVCRLQDPAASAGWWLRPGGLRAAKCQQPAAGCSVSASVRLPFGQAEPRRRRWRRAGAEPWSLASRRGREPRGRRVEARWDAGHGHTVLPTAVLDCWSAGGSWASGGWKNES
jgi:hypothetical protein